MSSSDQRSAECKFLHLLRAIYLFRFVYFAMECTPNQVFWVVPPNRLHLDIGSKFWILSKSSFLDLRADGVVVSFLIALRELLTVCFPLLLNFRHGAQKTSHHAEPPAARHERTQSCCAGAGKGGRH